MLTPLALHTLIALVDGDTYGYAIMQAIRESARGHVPVQTASFYRHLARLIDDGLVAEVAGRREDDDRRRGAYYRITPRGRQALLEEKRRLSSLVSHLNRLRLSPRKAGA